MTTSPVRTGLLELSRKECLERLGTVALGRVGLMGMQPAILPVNFALIDDTVVFRTSPGTKLATALRGALVVFEADAIDTATKAGWSVMVLGHAEVVDDRETLRRVASLDFESWVVGEGYEVVAVRPMKITGRQLVGS